MTSVLLGSIPLHLSPRRIAGRFELTTRAKESLLFFIRATTNSLRAGLEEDRKLLNVDDRDGR